MSEAIQLQIKDLSLFISEGDGKEQQKQILHEATMAVLKGKITCLVGESGSGKSLTIASILGLIPENAYFSEASSILFEGDTIYSVFQDPMNSFNPTIKIGKQLFQMAKGYKNCTYEIFEEGICPVLESMKFENPKQILGMYPFELSGGMLQRLMIGCGIFVEPSLIIADEPTTALDVTVQKDILRIFREINESFGTTLLVVTHDFGVVAEIADEVIVMQKGSVVESGNVFKIFDQPEQEYTKALIKATFKGSVQDVEN